MEKEEEEEKTSLENAKKQNNEKTASLGRHLWLVFCDLESLRRKTKTQYNVKFYDRRFKFYNGGQLC